MRKTLRRLLDRLRAGTSGTPRESTSVRGGLQQPQRMQPALVPVRIKP